MENKFDAIVIGTGISGGWAAKELTEKGLKTLVLERGRMVRHIEDYPTMNMHPWEFEGGITKTQKIYKDHPKQTRTGQITEHSKHFFVNDNDHPYNEAKPFNWIRGYHVGGRSLIWGRQTYRLSDLDFEANSKDGFGVDWPIRYKDISPWYDYVEEYIGVSGEKLGIAHFPDGKFLKPLDLNCAENYLKEKIAENYNDRVLTSARVAHITEGTKPGLGRITCQNRNLCRRGCPYGAYFSSNSSTIPAAEATGNMTLRPHSIAYEIMYDENTKKATGVKVIDSETNLTYEYFSKVIFVCASTVGSTSILLQSKSNRFPNGMGNDSNELGHNLMDHHFVIGAGGYLDEFSDKTVYGRRPGGIFVPRFRNINDETKMKNFVRGYGYQGGGGRGIKPYDTVKELASFGSVFKNLLVDPGKWSAGLSGFGEILPNHENKMYLDYEKKDKWGLPTVTFDARLRENEFEMRKDMKQQAQEMMESAGFKGVYSYDGIDTYNFGHGIHEMGTARMGKDPKTSVLNGNNQIHSVKNVYVTDGSCMTSAGNQNPSITYMALTARAVSHAVEELKKMNI